ncbi:MAG TPA: DNA polymerase/3'-5' exonuclease PolX [Candidatus Limnocylindrales bacterium]|nr:DNA polymerase/3'-5' exonuclease PolX [Candidatus Limnocylindrales bacterium]
MDKRDVARVLEQIAAILELKGENPFKVRAYENAARALDSLSEDLGVLIAETRLTEVRGIGTSIAANIVELWTQGRMKYYEELCDSVPPGWFDLMRIPGLGAKRIRNLCDLLTVSSVEDLKLAAEQGRVRRLKGFGEQSEKKILEGIAFLEKGGSRELGALVRPLAEGLVAALQERKDVEAVEVGGSLRRWLETVKDVDLLVATKKPAAVAKAFLEMLPGASIIAQGDTKTSVRLPSGLAVDLRLVTAEQFPFALHYFTGNVAHNVRIRQRAIDRGYSLNEYELSGAEHPPVRSEEELFRALDLPYIEPELREDRGEIEAAEAGTLPRLVTLADLKGILHCHTTYSDGKSTVQEMAQAAVEAGASYLGLSDHSQSARYAGGVSESGLTLQHAEIDKWNSRSRKLRILKGAEVDILPDGTLDYPDTVLERLDFVVASIHTNFSMSEEEMTARVVKAIRNKHVGILAHPTGRLILQRDGYRLNLATVFRVAAEEGVVIEINANPRRLELDWREVRAAKAQGLLFAVNPDAHHVNGYMDLRYGIGVARKGWLTPDDVINTFPVEKALARLQARR